MGRTGDSLEDNSPHKVGEEALSERCSLSEGKRGDPRVRWLLLFYPFHNKGEVSAGSVFLSRGGVGILAALPES